MSLALNNNYANLGSLPFAVAENAATGTMFVVFRTGATVPAGGIFTLYNATANQYMGFRVVGTTIEAGIRSGGGTPAVVVASVQPNTTYYLSFKKTATGGMSCRVNGNSAVTKTVSVTSTGYNRLGVGTYYNGSNITTTVGQVAYARYYSDSLADSEIDKFHSGNLSLMTTANLRYSYDLLSDLNSEVGGTALTFVDPESDPPVFDSFDPFAPTHTVSATTAATIGEASDISTSGFTPTAVNQGTIDGVNLTAASNTSITLPSFADEQLLPRPGTGRTLIVGNGTNTATNLADVNPPDGWDVVQIDPGFQVGEENSIAYQFDPPLALDDYIYFDPTKGTVTSLAGFETFETGTQVMWHHENSTKIVRSFNVITGEDGSITITRGIAAIGLSSAGLASIGLSAVGL